MTVLDGGGVRFLSDGMVMPAADDVQVAKAFYGARRGNGAWIFFETQRSWLPQALERLAVLKQLQPNWNSYGAEPVHPLAIQRAEQVLRTLADVTREPFVGPASRGGVAIEWHTDEVDIELVVGADGSFEAALEDRVSGLDWEGPASAEEVAKALARVS